MAGHSDKKYLMLYTTLFIGSVSLPGIVDYSNPFWQFVPSKITVAKFGNQKSTYDCMKFYTKHPNVVTTPTIPEHIIYYDDTSEQLTTLCLKVSASVKEGV